MELKGRYIVEAELGRGGIGVVYRARDTQLHAMPVVIKVLLAESSTNAWLKKKFLQEIEALARISHPGVVRVLDRGEMPDGEPFFVMEFVKGRPLRSVITPGGMDFDYSAHLVRQIGQALSAAHEQDVYHRDLKPENIMLQTLSDGDEQAKLIDFGIAKIRNSQVGPSTVTPLVAGSLHYMAPEQLLAQRISAATDIYALGVIAYEMLTGYRPFNPDAPDHLAARQQISDMQRAGVKVRPKDLRPSLPEAAQTALLKALAYEPQDRYAQARDFSEELARALTMKAEKFTLRSNPPSDQATLPASQVEAEPVPPPVPKARFSRNLAALIALLLLLLAVMMHPTVRSALFNRGSTAPNATPTLTPGGAAKSERLMSYSVIVQKFRNRDLIGDPLKLFGGINGSIYFQDDDRLRLSISSPQSGFFYLLNQGPEPKGGGAPKWYVLFPASEDQGGSASLAANEVKQVPNHGWFSFLGNKGTEKLWIVWAAQTVDVLETVKGMNNPTDQGLIRDARQAAEVWNFLSKHATTPPQVESDPVKKQTNVRSEGGMLVHLVSLEHR